MARGRPWRRAAVLRPRHLLVPAVVGVVVLLAVYWPSVIAALSSVERVRAWILGFGVFAPVAMVLAQAAQVVLAPVPGYFVAATAGYLFGPLAGTAYGVLGMLLGGTIAFGLARSFGTPLVERIISEQRLAQWVRFARADRLLTWIIILALPLGDVVYYAAGLTVLPLWKLLCATVVSRSVGVFLSTLVGAELPAVPPGLGLLLTVGVLTVAVVVFLVRESLRAFWQGILNRL